MLVDLIAFGAFAIGSPETPIAPVSVAAEQTATIRKATATGGAATNIPVGAFAWSLPLDPADRVPYAFDWTAMLAAGESIDELQRLTMSAVGAALGVMIDDDPDRLPTIDTGLKKIGLWFKVDPAFQTDPAFAGSGTQVAVTMLISTTSSPSKLFERTAILTVRQQ